MSAPIGTTPTFSLIFNEGDVDFSTANNIYVSFESDKCRVLKTGDELFVFEHQIDVYMTQEETLSLGVGSVEIQVNWTFGNENRAASEIAYFDFEKNLLKEVVS